MNGVALLGGFFFCLIVCLAWDLVFSSVSFFSISFSCIHSIRNRQQYNSTKIFAITLSFDYYVDKMLQWLKENPHASLRTRSYHGLSLDTRFKPTPHWMGFYASRPALKRFHYDLTQQLLNIEFLNAFSKLLFNCMVWMYLFTIYIYILR
jgi:hypothetical protein